MGAVGTPGRASGLPIASMVESADIQMDVVKRLLG